MLSVNLATLPEISFAPQSAAEVEAQIITTYEKLRNVTLQPGDPVRLSLTRSISSWSSPYLIGQMI